MDWPVLFNHGLPNDFSSRSEFLVCCERWEAEYGAVHGRQS